MYKNDKANYKIKWPWEAKMIYIVQVKSFLFLFDWDW